MFGLWCVLLKVGVVVIVFGIGVVVFYKIFMGVFKKWEEYCDGCVEIVEVKEYFIWGLIVLVVIVVILMIVVSIF